MLALYREAGKSERPPIAFYSFCRVHETPRCTPAMALGVTDHIWSVSELITEAFATPETPKPGPLAPPTTLRPGYTPFKPRVILDGKLRPKRERKSRFFQPSWGAMSSTTASFVFPPFSIVIPNDSNEYLRCAASSALVRTA